MKPRALEKIKVFFMHQKRNSYLLSSGNGSLPSIYGLEDNFNVLFYKQLYFVM